MKKLLMALTILGFTYISAEAQQKSKVCKKSSTKEVSCYETKYAQNFKICKGSYGYHVCGEPVTENNTTLPKLPIYPQEQSYSMQQESQDAAQDGMTAPQSQSYPTQATSLDVSNATSFEGYYPTGKKNSKIKSCYVGDNVAELSKAPYKGCNSPQSDGVEKNNNRNLNVSNNVE